MIAGIDVGSLIAGITALVVAVGGYLTNRQRKAAMDADALEVERDELRGQLEEALRHVHQLRKVIAENGIDAPTMPKGLRARKEPAP